MRVTAILTGCVASSATCLVLLAGPAVAQAPSGTVTGTWTGSLGQDEINRTPARIELAVNGRSVSGVVSGPELIPGDIVDGTYESRTGALRFSVLLRGTDQRFDFDGAIANDTLTVRASGGDGIFILRATRATGAPATRAPASPRTAADSALAAVHRSFVEVSGWVAAAARMMPPDRYGYRPTATVRTFGQLVAHVADAYEYYCRRAAGEYVDWTDAIERGAGDKATLLTALDGAQRRCETGYAGGGRVGPLIENVAHTNLHYGNLVTYLRMVGLEPPSS